MSGDSHHQTRQRTRGHRPPSVRTPTSGGVFRVPVPRKHQPCDYRSSISTAPARGGRGGGGGGTATDAGGVQMSMWTGLSRSTLFGAVSWMFADGSEQLDQPRASDHGSNCKTCRVFFVSLLVVILCTLGVGLCPLRYTGVVQQWPLAGPMAGTDFGHARTRRASTFPFSPRTSLCGIGLAQKGGGWFWNYGSRWGAPRDIPKWCENGSWLANWPGIILATHARDTTCKNVFFFSPGTNFGWIRLA